jgi:environmental stress-induced protein Ves
MIHLVDSNRVEPQPWRNGGGQARELLAWPAGGEWQLRVSVADIDRDGPFSAFPGVQRWFAVLSGAGVQLDLAAGGRTLTPMSPPLAFDGEEAPGCHLLDGPTRDLNLMARQAAGRAAMVAGAWGEPLGAGARWRGLVTAVAGRLLCLDTPVAVPAGALAWSDDDTLPWQFVPAEPGRSWWLTLERAE